MILDVEYLGHSISVKGIQSISEKIRDADGLSQIPVSNHVIMPCFRHSKLHLSELHQNVLSGWVTSNKPELQPYPSRAVELSVQDG